jgi:hypothetical protein
MKQNKKKFPWWILGYAIIGGPITVYSFTYDWEDQVWGVVMPAFMSLVTVFACALAYFEYKRINQ